MNKVIEENNKKADRCVAIVEQMNKETLIQGIRVFDQSMSYMATIIRWNQEELALLRTLETMILQGFNPEGAECSGTLISLDNMREKHREQQEQEIEKVDTTQAMEDIHVGTEH